MNGCIWRKQTHSSSILTHDGTWFLVYHGVSFWVSNMSNIAKLHGDGQRALTPHHFLGMLWICRYRPMKSDIDGHWLITICHWLMRIVTNNVIYGYWWIDYPPIINCYWWDIDGYFVMCHGKFLLDFLVPSLPSLVTWWPRLGETSWIAMESGNFPILSFHVKDIIIIRLSYTH